MLTKEGSPRTGAAGGGPQSLYQTSNRIARLVVLYFTNLPSLQLLAWHTYEKPHCVTNVLYIAFWAFLNCENQEFI